MRKVGENVYLLENLRGANVYALLDFGAVTLIDSGVRADVDQILAQLTSRDLTITRIVLTHAHVDHVGGAAELANRTGAQVIAHAADVPFIEQSQTMPASSVVHRLFACIVNRLFKLSACHVDVCVEDGDRIDALGGLRVLHTPGHTPGSMSLYHPERKLLFCGDALFNANPMTGQAGFQLPLRLVTLDNAQAARSVRLLADLPIEMLFPGHGEPITSGVDQRIKALLAST